MKEQVKFAIFYVTIILLSVLYCVTNWGNKSTSIHNYFPMFYPIAYLGTIVLVALANPLFLKKRFTTGVLIWFSVYNLFGVISQFFEYAEIISYRERIEAEVVKKWDITQGDIALVVVYVIFTGLAFLISYLIDKYSREKNQQPILEYKAPAMKITKVNIIKYVLVTLIGIGLAVLCCRILKVYFRPTLTLYATTASCLFAWSSAYSGIVNFVVFKYQRKRMLITWGVCYALFMVVCLTMGGPWYHYPV